MNLSIITKGKWYIIAVLLFVVFLVFTPITMFNEYPVLVSCVEGLLVAFFIFFGVINLESFGEILLLNQEDYPQLNSMPAVFVPLAGFILSSIICGVSTSSRIDRLIAKEGVYVAATINDGQETITHSLRHGNSSSYKVDLSFTLKDGSTMIVSEKISNEQFRNAYKGMVIGLKYLPKHPKICKLMMDDESISKFLGIQNRNVSFEDLEKLMVMKEDSVTGFLNKISQKWISSKADKGMQYQNDIRKEVIIRTNENVWLYSGVGLGGDPEKFIKGQKILNKTVEKEKGDKAILDKNIKTFVTEKYLIKYIATRELDGMRLEEKEYLLINPNISSDLKELLKKI